MKKAVVVLGLLAGLFTTLEDAPLNLDTMFGLQKWKPFEVTLHASVFFVVVLAVYAAYKMGKAKCA